MKGISKEPVDLGDKLLLAVTLAELLLKTALKFIFLIFLIVLLLIQHGYYNPYHSKNKPKTPVVTKKNSEPNPIAANENKRATQTPASSENIQCDGRTLCKQMTSCAEATFFLNNCPSTKRMDGNKNGVPCEQQWCSSVVAPKS